MLAILGTILISMVLGTNGLLECANPTENGTRITSDGLCVWLCAQPLCDLLGGPKPILPLLWNPPGGLPSLGGGQGQQGSQQQQQQQPRPNIQNQQWTTTTTTTANPRFSPRDGERCQSKCEQRLRSQVDRCDSQTLLKVMVEICPKTPLLQVCLTSCGCCAASNASTDACMQKCIREHGGVQVLGQLPGGLGSNGLLGGGRPETTTGSSWGQQQGTNGQGQNQGQGNGQSGNGQQGQNQGLGLGGVQGAAQGLPNQQGLGQGLPLPQLG